MDELQISREAWDRKGGAIKTGKTRTWREKLEKEQEAKIVEVTPKMAGRFGTVPGRKLLIPRPLDVDALIRQVPKGKVVTLSQIRERLAKNFNVDVTCPLSTGIFVRIASEAAEEDLGRGKKEITPYWRVIKERDYTLTSCRGMI